MLVCQYLSSDEDDVLRTGFKVCRGHRTSCVPTGIQTWDSLITRERGLTLTHRGRRPLHSTHTYRKNGRLCGCARERFLLLVCSSNVRIFMIFLLFTHAETIDSSYCSWFWVGIQYYFDILSFQRWYFTYQVKALCLLRISYISLPTLDINLRET